MKRKGLALFLLIFPFSSDDVIDVHSNKRLLYSSQRGEEGLGLSECAWCIRATVGCTQKVRPQSWASALLRHVNDQQLLWRWIKFYHWILEKKKFPEKFESVLTGPIHFWKMRSTLVARVRFSVLQSSLLHIYCCTVSICTVNERKRIAVVHNRACVCSNKLHWTLVLFPPLSPFSSSKTQRFWLLVIFFSLLCSPPAWLCGSD